jgi:hypothetical protein
MTKDAAIAIDRTTLQSVYTCTHPRMVPGRCTADRANPTGELAVVTVPPCIRPSKRSPSRSEDNTGTVKCSRVATRETLLEGGLTSTAPPQIPSILPRQVWFRTCRAQHGPIPILGGVVCTMSYRQVDPLGFRPGRAHVLQAHVNPNT